MSALMKSALGLMRDHAVPFSALYPFKASFYERMGYVCVHSKRKVVFSPAIFAGLRPSPALRLERMPAAGFDKSEYVTLLARLQKKVHGFARFADAALEKHMDWSEKVRRPTSKQSISAGALTQPRLSDYQIIPHWAVVVRDHKGIAGVLGYTVRVAVEAMVVSVGLMSCVAGAAGAVHDGNDEGRCVCLRERRRPNRTPELDRFSHGSGTYAIRSRLPVQSSQIGLTSGVCSAPGQGGYADHLARRRL